MTRKIDKNFLTQKQIKKIKTKHFCVRINSKTKRYEKI